MFFLPRHAGAVFDFCRASQGRGIRFTEGPGTGNRVAMSSGA